MFIVVGFFVRLPHVCLSAHLSISYRFDEGYHRPKKKIENENETFTQFDKLLKWRRHVIIVNLLIIVYIYRVCGEGHVKISEKKDYSRHY